jgi:Mn-dependent DtxR family transcriptional regulator
VMTEKKKFTAHEARGVGEQIGIDWKKAAFDVEQFRMGMDAELEHGLDNPNTNVSNDDPVVTGKIALAHLNEFSDYYTRLDRMETEAKQAAGRGE